MLNNKFFTGDNLVREIGKKNVTTYAVSALLLIFSITFGIIQIKAEHFFIGILYFVLSILVLVPHNLIKITQSLKFIILIALFIVLTFAFGGSWLKGTKKSVSPADLKDTTVRDGGVFNGDFELAPPFTAATDTINNWIDGTADGSGTDDKYGWALSGGGVANTQASFDSTVSHSGAYSFKLEKTDGVAGPAYTQMFIDGSPAVVTLENQNKYMVRVKPSISYKLSFWYKKNVAAGSSLISYQQFDGVSTTRISYASAGSDATLVTDWTYASKEFKTSETTTLLSLMPCVSTFTTGTAWFDDIKLEEVVTN